MKAHGRAFHLAAGLCGVAGALVLVGSFAMNPAPPSGLDAAALAAWAAPRGGLLLAGGWAQGIGSLLLVIFALSLVELAGDDAGLAGRIAALAGGTILMVSLLEVTFYFAASEAILTRDVLLGRVAQGLIRAVQHVFLVAPALLLPLGVVLLRTRLVLRVLGVAALALGGALQALGLVGLFAQLQPLIDIVLIAQSAWFVAAGLAVMTRRPIGGSAATTALAV